MINFDDYVCSEKHGEHNKCKWLDDRDFDYLFGKFYNFVQDTGKYSEIDFDGEGYIFDTFLEAVCEFYDEIAVTNRGYKYGDLVYLEKQNIADYFVEQICERLKAENYFA